ncbi:SSI family serine proteinase inhibitor [Actinoplanes sp. NPDC051411]|uniref:SSI family serine proteinase inhibitor n=1 Tax=Actinoplanes sp. NPDC051411 TaxID=3155522 RepID=UPI003434D4B6
MIRTLIAAALLFNPAPAQSHLTLTYAAQTVRLACNPTAGDHPEAAQACAVLRRTGADPAKIKPAQVMCVMLWQPVTARIAGTWRGAPVKWTHQYGNSCEMTRATGVLFKF